MPKLTDDQRHKKRWKYEIRRRARQKNLRKYGYGYPTNKPAEKPISTQEVKVVAEPVKKKSYAWLWWLLIGIIATVVFIFV